MRLVDLHTIEKGTGEPLLFVHGSASDYRTWEAQLPFFAEHYRTLAYSRRYHWPNPPIPEHEDYSMMQHLEDLNDFITKNAPAGAHLVGHSYGAFLCLKLAMQQPGLVRTLTLAEPPLITLFVSNNPTPGELLKLLFTSPSMALALLKFGIRGIGPAKRAFENNQPEKALDIFGSATLGAATYRSLSAARKEQARNNLFKMELLGSGFPKLDKKLIREIRIPVLLLSGEKSPRLFRLILHALHELIPHAALLTIAEASHIMHEDNVREYNNALRSFLQLHGDSGTI